MRIVHIATNDIIGGAARAAYRLHDGLRSIGCESTMYVMRKQSTDTSVQRYVAPRNLSSRLLRQLRHQRITRSFARYRRSRPAGYEIFSDDRAKFGRTMLQQIPDCDLINLHWVARFVDYSAFFSSVPRHTPVVWTLHDMNPFTGGCHYDHGCGRFVARCGGCPQLGSDEMNDLSRHVWRRKEAAFAQIPPGRLHIVASSRWMADEVRRSTLFKRFPVARIPLGLETDAFSPRDQECARKALGIPEGTRVVLFAAQSISNRRKGFDLLIDAFERMSFSNILLMSVGEHRPSLKTDMDQLHLGYINSNDLLSVAYSAADLYAIPSLQEAFGQTALESISCGTPVVGFDVGGIPDMVRPGITGELVPAGDVSGLATTIDCLLDDHKKLQKMGKNCRRTAVEEYSLELQARYYLEFYEKILIESRI